MSCIVLPAASVISRPKSPDRLARISGLAPHLAASPAPRIAAPSRTAGSAAGACRVLSRIIVLAALAAVTPTPAAAQSGRGLGGGFLEFLFSGGATDGAPPAARPAYAPAGPQGEWRVDSRYARQLVPYDGEESRAPLSSIRRNACSISSSLAARRCATGSASAAPDSPGPGPNMSR